MGVPGCPDLAACTASMDSVRIVLMASRSRSPSLMAPPFALAGMTCPLERGHLAETAQVPRGLAVLGGEKGLDQVPGQLRPDRSPAQAEDVHVIVLDALPGGKVVLDETGAHPGNLVGAHCDAHATPAQGQPTLHRARHQRAAERYHVVRIVVGGLEGMGAEVGHLVSGGPQPSRHLYLQVKSTVIGRDAHAHARVSLVSGRRKRTGPPPRRTGRGGPG